MLPSDEHLPLLSVGDTFRFADENADLINESDFERYLEVLAKRRLVERWEEQRGVSVAERHTVVNPNDQEAGIFPLGMTEAEIAELEKESKQVADQLYHETLKMKEESVDVILRVLRLSHVRETVVGNAMIRVLLNYVVFH